MAGNRFALKPAAAVATARRAGMTSSIDVIHRYFNLVGMPVVSSNYYNMIFGRTPEELLKRRRRCADDASSRKEYGMDS